ncbi:DNA-directed RNA polymerase III subunit RPC7 [Eublepharis macularius]|uniref:DNA-directed RNA polymerase III subunit n=1 Tax=Eublepharis macularius TaxID=481883 RepID=A0AA97JSZ6_EUBMA|nr:DNA-directed RNA polymerase III subunit RPC7 [Eublepharis macularius]
MARSGRGRGRTAFTFDVGAIGFARGEALPEAAFKPSALYPPTDFKPVPLKAGEDEDYLVALKQEFRTTVRNTPYFVCIKNEDQGVERYSKKYLRINQADLEWTPDWRQLPREMKPKKKITKGGKLKTKPAVSKANVDVLKKLEELEKKSDGEKSDEEEKEKERGEEEEEAEEPDEYDEEEHEEENDYISSYFEDGDDYGAGSDDNMDEATY